MSLFANDVAFIAIFSLRLKAKEKQPIYMQYAVNWKCEKNTLAVKRLKPFIGEEALLLSLIKKTLRLSSTIYIRTIPSAVIPK
jgi:hypothetical protein